MWFLLYSVLKQQIVFYLGLYFSNISKYFFIFLIPKILSFYTIQKKQKVPACDGGYHAILSLPCLVVPFQVFSASALFELFSLTAMFAETMKKWKATIGF